MAQLVVRSTVQWWDGWIIDTDYITGWVVTMAIYIDGRRHLCGDSLRMILFPDEDLVEGSHGEEGVCNAHTHPPPPDPLEVPPQYALQERGE